MILGLVFFPLLPLPSPNSHQTSTMPLSLSSSSFRHYQPPQWEMPSLCYLNYGKRTSFLWSGENCICHLDVSSSVTVSEKVAVWKSVAMMVKQKYSQNRSSLLSFISLNKNFPLRILPFPSALVHKKTKHLFFVLSSGWLFIQVYPLSGDGNCSNKSSSTH